MKTRSVLILCTALLLSMPPCSDAQSLKDGLKNIGDKIGKQIQSTKNQITKKTTTTKPTTNKPSANKTSDRDKALQKQYDAMMGNPPEMEDEKPTIKLPDEHTALFAPLGYPVEAAYGTLTVKPGMPPQSPDAQVNWTDKLPNISNLNNKSLVDEYLLLKDCFDNGYFKTLTPAHARLENVEGELYARANDLNYLVELMAKVRSEYGSESPQWVINGMHDKIASILEGEKYKTLIKSSISPFFTVKGLINDKTKEYFQKHGGYENATKVTMTKWDPKPVKQSISTSGSGQSGTIVSENASGATVDIGGIIYIVHASKGFAFASEAVNTAVAGKDIVMPDYINYKGKRFPVTEMRGDIFWGKPIKSIKLPSTLTEISNAALRETDISEIVIPASVKIIQGSAFYGCKNLKKVVFESDKLDELHGCFQNCTSLQSIKLPRYVGLSSYDMFSGCTNLTSVTLPENLKELYDGTFENCIKLTTINIPASVTKVGSHVFSGSGVVSLDLSHVTEIGVFTFDDCKSLKNLKLNSKLKDNFLMEIYPELMTCPYMEVKWVNNQYVYPAGLEFVDPK